MLCTHVAWLCLLLCKEEGSSPVYTFTESIDLGMYEMPLSMSLLDFGMWTMLANFHMCGIMLLLMLIERNVSPFVIIFMLFMYTNQSMCVQWKDNLSDNFSIGNGVRVFRKLCPVPFLYLENVRRLYCSL